MAITSYSYRAWTMKSSLICLALTLSLFHHADAGKEKSFCNVCRVVVEEANWKISQSDPKKTIQVGSFRVDPHGNQNIKEKTYARSESHVEEIFESVCDEFRNYAELKQDDGSKTIVRTVGRHGKRLQTTDYNLDMSSGKKLTYLCHDFLENHEEAVMGLLQREDIDSYEKIICGAQTRVCSGKELSSPMIELPEFVEEEKPEPVDENKDTSDNDEQEGDSIASEFENLMDQGEKDEL